MIDHVKHTQRLSSLIRQCDGLNDGARELWTEAEKEFGPQIFTWVLYRMTRLELPPEQARTCILDTLAHQRRMATALGRCVTLTTALCDFFSSTNPLLKEPVLVELRLLLQKEEVALHDELTGLFNRRYFNQELEREIERFRRFGHPFSLLLLDLDHFKVFNDSHGHTAGDKALRDLAGLLGATVRLYDRAVRYGGEEFAIILPQASQAEALTMAERIRKASEQHAIEFGSATLEPITVSIGSATFPQDALEMAELVCRADEALYEAKRTRNTVSAYKDANRRHTRFPLSTPLPVHIHANSATQLDAQTLDVSFGGLLCETHLNIAPGTTVELILADKQRGIELPLKARVRRASNPSGETYHLGLSFELHTNEQQKTLLCLLDGHSSRPAKPATQQEQTLLA